MRRFLVSLYVMVLCVVANAQIVEPVHWSSSYQQEGKTLKVSFSARIDASYHIYAMDIPDGGPQRTEFQFGTIDGLVAVGKPQVTLGKKLSLKDENFGMLLSFYEDKVTFTQSFSVQKEAWKLEGNVCYMACNAQMCTPPVSWEFSLEPTDPTTDPTPTLPGEGVEKTGSANQGENVQMQDSLETLDKLDTLDTISPDSASLSPSVVSNNPPSLGRDGVGSLGSSWLYIFLAGFLAGLIALVTPCVWPMIPMTVSFFLKRTKDRKKSVRDAWTYGISIIVIYVLLGLVVTAIFGASALNSLATNAIFNIIFFLLLVVFAFSFFGAFELTLPSSWTTKLDEKADATTGLISIFFMAFTLCLVSFSCTGPIIGTLLVEAATSGSMLYPAIGMFGFALALSLPFTLFALFPSMLKSMPKSGGWLNSVKVVLGFCELALSLKFLSVADLAYGWGILDREVFLCLWIVIFLFLGLYLLGFIRLPHDDDPQPSDRVSVTRLMLALISIAFAIYMVPGLWGAPCKAISAFAPPMSTQDFNLGEQAVTTYHDYDEALAAARRSGKTVLVDFSGYGCVNCRKMEAAVLTDPEVKQMISDKFIFVELMVDDKTSLPEIKEVEENGRTVKLRTVGDRWSYLQRSRFGANAQPFYILLDANGEPLSGGYGYDEDVKAYLQFLQQGVKN